MGTRSSKVLHSPGSRKITDADFIGIDYTTVKGKINSIYDSKAKNVYFISVRPGDVYEDNGPKDPDRVRVLYDAVNYKITHVLHG
jgi:hypothetical protein